MTKERKNTTGRKGLASQRVEEMHQPDGEMSPDCRSSIRRRRHVGIRQMKALRPPI